MTTPDEFSTDEKWLWWILVISNFIFIGVFHGELIPDYEVEYLNYLIDNGLSIIVLGTYPIAMSVTARGFSCFGKRWSVRKKIGVTCSVISFLGWVCFVFIHPAWISSQ